MESRAKTRLPWLVLVLVVAAGAWFAATQVGARFHGLDPTSERDRARLHEIAQTATPLIGRSILAMARR